MRPDEKRIVHNISVVEGALETYSSIASKINTAINRIAKLEKLDEAALVKINISTTMLDLPRDEAIQIISKSIDLESEYLALYNKRIERAIEFITGKRDAEL